MENYKYVLFQDLLEEAYDELCYGVYDGETIVCLCCGGVFEEDSFRIIRDVDRKQDRYEDIFEQAYHRYCLDWMLANGHSLEELFEVLRVNSSPSINAAEEDFLISGFCDGRFMDYSEFLKTVVEDIEYIDSLMRRCCQYSRQPWIVHSGEAETSNDDRIVILDNPAAPSANYGSAIVSSKAELYRELRRIGYTDTDFCGENGPEYLWDIAKGYPSNLDCVMVAVSTYCASMSFNREMVTKAVSTFFTEWMNHDSSYYSECSFQVTPIRHTNRESFLVTWSLRAFE